MKHSLLKGPSTRREQGAYGGEVGRRLSTDRSFAAYPARGAAATSKHVAVQVHYNTRGRS